LESKKVADNDPYRNRKYQPNHNKVSGHSLLSLVLEEKGKHAKREAYKANCLQNVSENVRRKSHKLLVLSHSFYTVCHPCHKGRNFASLVTLASDQHTQQEKGDTSEKWDQS
jgi:hypothetical protein